MHQHLSAHHNSSMRLQKVAFAQRPEHRTHYCKVSLKGLSVVQKIHQDMLLLKSKEIFKDSWKRNITKNHVQTSNVFLKIYLYLLAS